MKRLTLTLGALVLGALCSHSALAESFSFSFTGSLYSGSGTFNASNAGSGPGGSTEWSITSFNSGSVTNLFNQTSNILSTVSSFNGADNLVYDPGIVGLYNLDGSGISFALQNGTKINLSSTLFFYQAQGSTLFSYETLDSFSLTDTTVKTPPPPAVPEPSSLALLGTGVLSATGAIRHRLKK